MVARRLLLVRRVVPLEMGFSLGDATLVLGVVFPFGTSAAEVAGHFLRDVRGEVRIGGTTRVEAAVAFEVDLIHVSILEHAGPSNPLG